MSEQGKDPASNLHSRHSAGSEQRTVGVFLAAVDVGTLGLQQGPSMLGRLVLVRHAVHEEAARQQPCKPSA